MILTCLKHQLLNQLFMLWLNYSIIEFILQRSPGEKKSAVVDFVWPDSCNNIVDLWEEQLLLICSMWTDSCCSDWKNQQMLVELTTCAEQDYISRCLSVVTSADVLQELLNGRLVWLHNISWWITWKSPPPGKFAYCSLTFAVLCSQNCAPTIGLLSWCRLY